VTNRRRHTRNATASILGTTAEAGRPPVRPGFKHLCSGDCSTVIPTANSEAGPAREASIGNRVPFTPGDRTARSRDGEPYRGSPSRRNPELFPQRRPMRQLRPEILEDRASPSARKDGSSSPSKWPCLAESRADSQRSVPGHHPRRLRQDVAQTVRPRQVVTRNDQDWRIPPSIVPRGHAGIHISNLLRRNVMKSIDADSPRTDSARRTRCDG
jgi:hypothetical protein